MSYRENESFISTLGLRKYLMRKNAEQSGEPIEDENIEKFLYDEGEFGEGVLSAFDLDEPELQESVDSGKDATEVVRELYVLFPEVEFYDERDLGDKVALLFEINKLGPDKIDELKATLDEWGVDYAFKGPRLRVIAPEVETYLEKVDEGLSFAEKKLQNFLKGKGIDIKNIKIQPGARNNLMLVSRRDGKAFRLDRNFFSDNEFNELGNLGYVTEALTEDVSLGEENLEKFLSMCPGALDSAASKTEQEPGGCYYELADFTFEKRIHFYDDGSVELEGEEEGEVFPPYHYDSFEEFVDSGDLAEFAEYHYINEAVNGISVSKIENAINSDLTTKSNVSLGDDNVLTIKIDEPEKMNELIDWCDRNLEKLLKGFYIASESDGDGSETNVLYVELEESDNESLTEGIKFVVKGSYQDPNQRWSAFGKSFKKTIVAKDEDSVKDIIKRRLGTDRVTFDSIEKLEESLIEGVGLDRKTVNDFVKKLKENGYKIDDFREDSEIVNSSLEPFIKVVFSKKDSPIDEIEAARFYMRTGNIFYRVTKNWEPFSEKTYSSYGDFIKDLFGAVASESLTESKEPSRADVVDWLSDHETAYKDAVQYFKKNWPHTWDLNKVPIDDLLYWISYHKTLAQDFMNYFGVGEEYLFDESLTEDKNINEAVDWKNLIDKKGNRLIYSFETGGVKAPLNLRRDEVADMLDSLGIDEYTDNDIIEFKKAWRDYIKEYRSQNESLTEGAMTNGSYSLYNGWVKVPDKDSIPDEYPDLEPEYSEWVERAESCETVEDVDNFLDDVYKLRQQGLLATGEYGKENLIFKELRNNGYLQKVKDMKVEKQNQEMSLESLEEAAGLDIGKRNATAFYNYLAANDGLMIGYNGEGRASIDDEDDYYSIRLYSQIADWEAKFYKDGTVNVQAEIDWDDDEEDSDIDETFNSYNEFVDWYKDQMYSWTDDCGDNLEYIQDDASVIDYDESLEESKNLNEAGSITAEKLGDFIEDSVDSLHNSDFTNNRFVLDDDLCLYVGWSAADEGYEGEADYEDGWIITAKIAEKNDYDWADFDFLDMPYDEDTGDVWDTQITGPRFPDGAWFLEQYKEIRQALDDGEVTV